MLIGLGVVMIALTAPRLAELVPGCMFLRLTGLYCPGCGTGRAIRELASGDVAGALRMNAFTLLALPAIVLALGRDALTGLGLARPGRGSATVLWPIAIAAIVVAFWVLRNVPIWPFELLAPH